MSSKQIRAALVVGVLTSLVMTACTPKVGEDPPPQVTQGLGGTECLTETAETVRAFFKGEAEDDKVAEAWGCLSLAFEKFNKYVRGENRDYFTPQELADFFEQNLMRKGPDGSIPQRITPKLQAELMKFKEIFVGGSRESVTREEILKTLRIFHELKKITVGINPYMKILVLAWTPAEGAKSRTVDDKEFFERANREMQVAVKDLATLAHPGHRPYLISDFGNFFAELSAFYGEEWPIVRLVRNYLPVAQKVKKALAGGTDSEILSNEWRRILILGGRAYFQFLRYHYFIRGPVEQGQGLPLASIASMVEDVLSLFEDLVREKPSGVVSRQEINEILDSFSRAFPAFKYSDTFGLELMKLKQVLFGGTREACSVDDFETARLKIENLRLIFERVYPYFPLYGLDWDPSGMSAADAFAYFSEGKAALEQSAQEFGDSLRAPYDLKDALSAAREWDRLYPPEPPSQGLAKTVEQYLPAVQRLKNVVFSDSGSSIQTSQWGGFLRFAGEGFMNYLYFRYMLPDGFKLEEKSLDAVAQLGEYALTLMKNMLERKTSRQLSLSELDQLMADLGKALPGLRYSSALGAEIMKLKKALIGGGDTSWSAADSEAVRARLRPWLAHYRGLLPYWDVYTSKWDPSAMDFAKAEAYFFTAGTVLQKTAAALGKEFTGSYDLENLKPLIGELVRLYPPGKPDLDETVEKYLPLVILAKNTIFADSDSILRKDQAEVAFEFVGEAYSDYLYYGFFVKDRNLDRPENLQGLSRVVELGTGLVDKILLRQPSQVLGKGRLAEIVGGLKRAGVLPDDLREETVLGLIDVALFRLLQTPEKRLSGQRPEALALAATEHLRFEFAVWLQTQEFLLRTIQSQPGVEMDSADLRAAVNKAAEDASSSEALKQGLREVSMILDTPVPLVLDAHGRLVISARVKPKLNQATLKQYNLVRALDRALLFAYVGEASRLRNYKGATLEEAQLAFRELKPLAVDIGLLTPENTTFVDNRFREANIFMPRSNGDNIASFQEISDILNMIFSGLTLDNQLRPALLKSCSPNNLEPKPTDTVEYGCFFESYRAQFPTVLTSLPEILKFQKAHSKSVFNVFIYNSLKAAGYRPNPRHQVKFEDSALLVHLIQYIEMILARFDTNKDTAIDVSEARRAFPSFKALFKELAKKEIESGLIKEEELFALFTYILKYGKPPSGIWEGLTKWYPWKRHPEKWSVWADRNKMGQILGFIADELAKSADGSVKMLPEEATLD